MLYHIVAMAQNRVIGKENRLPWHFSSDLKHFKKLTLGETVLMGRKTFESIGKPLPGRENFVLSQSEGRTVQGAKSFKSIEEALKFVSTKHCYIIGGASLYQQTLSRIDGIYLTQIHADYEGDTFYPEIPSRFKEKLREKLQENPLIEIVFYENAGKR